jgi:hypothetical protein
MDDRGYTPGMGMAFPLRRLTQQFGSNSNNLTCIPKIFRGFFQPLQEKSGI